MEVSRGIHFSVSVQRMGGGTLTPDFLSGSKNCSRQSIGALCGWLRVRIRIRVRVRVRIRVESLARMSTGDAVVAISSDIC